MTTTDTVAEFVERQRRERIEAGLPPNIVDAINLTRDETSTPHTSGRPSDVHPAHSTWRCDECGNRIELLIRPSAVPICCRKAHHRKASP